MIGHLFYLFFNMMLISLLTFGAGSPAYFYQFGVLQSHWITKGDLSAIIAFGYASPGPVVNGTAPFIGYRIAGLLGFIVGTVGIFIAPLTLSILAARYLNKLQDHVHVKLFIKGVGIAAPAVVATTAISLLPPHTASSAKYLLIAIGAFIVSVKWKANPFLTLIIGGLLGAF
ncbi:MAG TPA: chromate transporter [Candidatus Saccharimonadales bacterium]|nr:chromate transporter [Candidatus Saccharimonadales bacterium]